MVKVFFHLARLVRPVHVQLLRHCCCYKHPLVALIENLERPEDYSWTVYYHVHY